MAATRKKETTRKMATAFLLLQNGEKTIKLLKATPVRDTRTQNALLDQEIVMAISFLLTWRDPLLGTN